MINVINESGNNLPDRNIGRYSDLFVYLSKEINKIRESCKVACDKISLFKDFTKKLNRFFVNELDLSYVKQFENKKKWENFNLKEEKDFFVKKTYFLEKSNEELKKCVEEYKLILEEKEKNNKLKEERISLMNTQIDNLNIELSKSTEVIKNLKEDNNYLYNIKLENENLKKEVNIKNEYIAKQKVLIDKYRHIKDLYIKLKENIKTKK